MYGMSRVKNESETFQNNELRTHKRQYCNICEYEYVSMYLYTIYVQKYTPSLHMYVFWG